MKLLYTVLLIPTLLTAQQEERTRITKEQQEITIVQPPAPPLRTPPAQQVPLDRQEQLPRRSAPDIRNDTRPIPRMPMSIPWTPATERDCYTVAYNIRDACLRFTRQPQYIPSRQQRPMSALRQRMQRATPRQRDAIRRARENFRREVDRILRSK